MHGSYDNKRHFKVVKSPNQAFLTVNLLFVTVTTQKATKNTMTKTLFCGLMIIRICKPDFLFSSSKYLLIPFLEKLMKVLKYSALALAVVSGSAMANVISNTADTVVEGGKTIIQTVAKPAAFGVEVGTLGYGANVSWGVTDSVELQAGWNGGKLDVDADIGGNDSIINWKEVLGNEYKDFQGNLKAEVKGDSPYLGLQARPFKNAFTIGTGIIIPNQDVSATLTTNAGNSKITVDGKEHTLAAGDVITISAEPRNKLAPYATIGVRPNISSRFGLSAEIGAAYVGNYDVNVEANDPALRADLEKKIDKDNVGWYPVAKLGATIRF